MIPFCAKDWPRKELREAVEILWNWHQASESDALSIHSRDQAHSVCIQYNLPAQLVDAQFMEYSNLVPKTSQDLFEYIDTRVGSHALLLAKLAGYTAKWVETPVKQFARAIFLTRSICFLSQDLMSGRQYIPLDLMENARVTQSDLIRGKVSPEIRSLLWKQMVRARDAYASSKTLNSDLNGWCRRRFRIYWLSGLHTLAQIESRKFDVWSKPIRLNPLHKTSVYLQATIGKPN